MTIAAMGPKTCASARQSVPSASRVCTRVRSELTLGFVILLQVGETTADGVQLALSLFRMLARAEELWLGQVALGEFLAQV